MAIGPVGSAYDPMIIRSSPLTSEYRSFFSIFSGKLLLPADLILDPLTRFCGYRKLRLALQGLFVRPNVTMSQALSSRPTHRRRSTGMFLILRQFDRDDIVGGHRETPSSNTARILGRVVSPIRRGDHVHLTMVGKGTTLQDLCSERFQPATQMKGNLQNYCSHCATTI